jgi:hypothetical protein
MDIRRLSYQYRKYHNSVDELSIFAGYYLAHGVWAIACQRPLSPFGITRRFSFLRGCLDVSYQFQFNKTEVGKEIENALANWYMNNHMNQYYVAVVMDIYMTIKSVRTEAIKMVARFGDFSADMIIYLPYTRATDNTGLKLAAPILDFPDRHPSLAKQRERILRGLHRGRDRIRNREMRKAAAWD